MRTFINSVAVFALLVLRVHAAIGCQKDGAQERHEIDVTTESVWQYDFVDDAHRWQGPDNRVVNVPPLVFGQLLVSQDRERFVYRFVKQNVALGQLDPNSDLRYLCVAGFDGQTYWGASFQKWVHQKSFYGLLDYVGPMETRRAAVVHCWPDKEFLDKYHQKYDDPINSSQSLWYELAPIHQLFFRTDVAKWDYETIQKRFDNCKLTSTVFADGKALKDAKEFRGQLRIVPAEFIDTKTPDTRYVWFDATIDRNVGGYRNYLVELRKEDPFISKCRVAFVFNFWSGPWPFIEPISDYTIVLNPKLVSVDKNVFCAKYYSTDSTTVEQMQLSGN